MDKKKLAQEFIRGDKAAFDWIYTNYAKGMYAICLRYTKNQDEAADILQEAFIKVYEKRSLFNPVYEIGPWVKRIVINQAINHFRSNKRFELVEDDSYFEEPEETLEIEDLNNVREALVTILQELPEGYRTVFNMYVIDNLTHQEIAEYLGVSVNTSKTQLLKARKLIRQKLEERKITRSSIKDEQGI
ncbi:MAG: RNA polymerase sigma factor [Bacteroidetes bacterium]|nr:RNA polymerase sigma factor [Bacteroidota bacterium]